MISKTIWTCKKCGEEFYPCEDFYKENRFAHYDGNIPIKLCNGEVVPVVWFQADDIRKAIRKLDLKKYDGKFTGLINKHALLKELGV